MRKASFIVLLILFFVVIGCQKGEESAAGESADAKPKKSATITDEPERVEVQHILISFQGAIPDEKVTRTKEEAESLAKELLEMAKSGDDFDALVKEYTDDQHPGIYRMSNVGIPPDSASQEFSRERMVKAFGDVSFSLNVNEIGMANYDPTASKYGWHIIKRLK
jgi:parvulin-like peptidyl-prolyl isomerase